MIKKSSLTVTIVLLLVSMLLAACGSQKSGGKDSITIGVSVPAESNNTVKTWFEAIKAQAAASGMKVIGIDAQFTPTKQVSDIDSLITQGADAIIIWPLDAASLSPAISRINEKKIPVIGTDFNVKTGGPDYSLTSQIIFNRDEGAVQVAKLFADSFPNGAEVAGIGMAVPVPGNVFVMEKYKTETAQYPNLKWVEQQDNPTDNIAGAEPLMANLLTKFPNLQAVFAYNDESAIGAAQAVLNAGKMLYSKDNPTGIMIVGYNAEQSGNDAVTQGKIHATFNLNPVKAGVASVDLIRELLVDKKDAGSIAKEVVIPSPLVSVDNLDQFVTWNDEIASIK